MEISHATERHNVDVYVGQVRVAEMKGYEFYSKYNVNYPHTTNPVFYRKNQWQKVC
jgi:hypothetical protein